MMSGRFAGSRELGNPLLLPARELLDWVYFIATEGLDSKGLKRFNYNMEPLETPGSKTEDDQGDRRARILAMGGGVG